MRKNKWEFHLKLIHLDVFGATDGNLSMLIFISKVHNGNDTKFSYQRIRSFQIQHTNATAADWRTRVHAFLSIRAWLYWKLYTAA